jgi:hypothetical protein
MATLVDRSPNLLGLTRDRQPPTRAQQGLDHGILATQQLARAGQQQSSERTGGGEHRQARQ